MTTIKGKKETVHKKCALEKGVDCEFESRVAFYLIKYLVKVKNAVALLCPLYQVSEAIELSLDE